MNSLDEVLPEIQAINESIQDILADIKTNTSNKNQQTIQENKTKLRQIARKLKELKESLIPFYHKKKTIQADLGTFEKDKKINKQLIKRNY